MGESFDIDIDATDPKSPEGKDVCEECDTLLSVRGIRKSFGSNEVLKGINLDLAPGEVISLIGGNGSGKSTLMKIIMGIYSADEGEISIDRQKVDISNPKAALAHSIYMVPQEPMLFPNMTVRENITIGFEAPKAELNKMLEDTMKEIGWELDLDRKAMTLSIAEQGMVEILRGLMRHSEILILDEPTSALTFDEVQSLFKVVQELKQKNIGIIYITHRLAEVFEISTSIGILRDGVMAMRGKVEDFTREDLVRGLLPPDAAEIKKEIAESANIDYDAEPIFELAEFTGYGFADVNLNIYPGEIVGLAGIVGAGRSEMATTIYGMDKVLGGKVYVYTNGQWVENLPKEFKDFSAVTGIGDFTVYYCAVIALVILIHFALTQTRRGRWFAAVGDNANGATLVGIPALQTKILAYIFCSRIGFVTPMSGNGYEMKAIAACVLGGVSLLGGVGSVLGAAVGSVIMASISYLLVFMGFSSNYDNAITGVILIVIVVVDALLQHRSIVQNRHARLNARVSPKSSSEVLAEQIADFGEAAMSPLGKKGGVR